METYADMQCLLKMNFQCDPCKRKVMEVLGSITGVYSITMNAEKGTVEVSGEVDPNMLLWSLATSGKHAELVWVKFNSPALSRSYNYNYNYYNNNVYGSYGSYGYEPLDQSSYYGMNLPYNTSRRSDPWYDSNYVHSYLPPARYVPGLPPVADPYEYGEPINLCSIM